MTPMRGPSAALQLYLPGLGRRTINPKSPCAGERYKRGSAKNPNDETRMMKLE
jgi:hypothetical protein